VSLATPPEPDGSGTSTSAEERIMVATLAALTALDPSALTIQRICREAQVTPPTVYYHFGSKDGLVAAAIEQMLTAWSAALDQQIPREGSFDQVLAKASGAWEAMILEPARPLAVFSWATLLTAAGSLQCREALQLARQHSESQLDVGLAPHIADAQTRTELAAVIMDVLIATALHYHLDGDSAAVRQRIAVLGNTIRRAAGRN
jgi:AcrR family transcriptional regulator